MTPRTLAALGAACLALCATPSLAQTAMAGDHMAKDKMDKPTAAATPMPRSDEKAAKACAKLSHDAMMKDARCQHPAKPPSAMSNDAMAAPKDNAMMAGH